MLVLAKASRARDGLIKVVDGESRGESERGSGARVAAALLHSIATSPPDDAGSPASACGEACTSHRNTRTARDPLQGSFHSSTLNGKMF